MSRNDSKSTSKRHSDFKGVNKTGKKYFVQDINGEYKSFKYEVDAARYYNDLLAKRKGLAARINTVPVPGLECLGNCEYELGPHYFTKEDLEPKD